MTPPRLLRLLTGPPLLLLIGSLASADAITGRVVDANGVGVAGVDIDFVSLGSGGNPHEANDGTDANGNFFTTVDAGVYEIRFFPPAPPATTLLTGVVTPVVVTGTKNMGTITLTQGVAVQGSVKNAANQPVGNVKLDVFSVATGARVLLKGNFTNAFGNFLLALPTTALNFQVLTNAVVGQVLVPVELQATISGPTNLGNLVLQTGFHVTGTMRTQAGAVVPGADVDVTDLVTGATLFTPSDNTNSAGVFDVVVPAGTYDFEITRPAALVLVAVGLDGVPISAATDLGIHVMRPGVFLSGTIRDRRNAPILAADVNVIEVANGLSVTLGPDNTNAAGFYSVVVPSGTMDVTFSPPGPHDVLDKRRIDGVSVVGNTVLDGRLPGAPGNFGQAPSPRVYQPVVMPYGSGTSGSGSSVPHLLGSLAPDASHLTLRVFGGRPGALAEVRFGLEARALRAGAQLLRPLTTFALRLDAEGSARLDLALPTGLTAHTLLAQALVLDPEAAQGVALTNLAALASPR